MSTDRHPQIRKLMRLDPSFNVIKHQFVPWHVAKGICKSLNKASVKKKQTSCCNGYRRSSTISGRALVLVIRVRKYFMRRWLFKLSQYLLPPKQEHSKIYMRNNTPTPSPHPSPPSRLGGGHSEGVINLVLFRSF